MRERAHGYIVDAAYRLALASRYPAFRRKRGAAIFAFHNVVEDDGIPSRCEASLHMPLSAFQDYLALIADGYTIVALTEIADRVRRRRDVEGLAAITFDDAYHGMLTYAVPTMARRALPCSMFVVSGAAAAPSPFWWDLISPNGSMSRAARDRALGELRGDAKAVMAQHAADHHAMPASLLPASWGEVRIAARNGVAIGSHTVSHRNLAALDPTAVRKEMERSRAEIAAAIGAPPDAVSYPYGLLNQEVIDAARRAGYTSGVTLRFGLATREDEPLALPRINVPAGISLTAFECWAAGVRLRGAS